MSPIVIKKLIFPGINLHARLRYNRIPRHFDTADSSPRSRLVLDAGTGNGMLAYKAWLKGARVFGVSIKPSEVSGARSLFNDYLNIPQSELCFRTGNLYELSFPESSFDQIICSETLEHLRRDGEVCRKFWSLLKPGGVLHLCAPNSDHPYNASFPLDPEERGGHVRPGYTLETWKSLLSPIGFKITYSEGLGGPIRQFFNRYIKETQERFGAFAGLPIFLLAQFFLPFEQSKSEHCMPFSIYVQAVKPLEG